MSVIVAYSTKNGSTTEVAGEIAARLREQGLTVDVKLCGEVRSFDGVQALIVGAPIYSGRWLSSAHRVLKRLKKIPPERRPPLAVFALGPRRNESPDDWVRPREQFERTLAKHPDISPATIALFGGVDPPKKRPRRDVRDWEAIRTWADEVSGLVHT
jgi:menaquinone-dependent protoporphyrinogen oxidase